MDSKSAIEVWDRNAQNFTDHLGEHGDLSRQHLLNPVLFEMIGDVAGKKVLDLGCGEGYMSRYLAQQGAEVMAVDYAEEFVKIAREKTPGEANITYLHANAESLDCQADASFDLVVSSMMLQDLPDYVSALGEMRRVLKENGRIVLAILHPVFSSDGIWQRDDAGKKLFWRMDNYFHETMRLQFIPCIEEGLPYFHRTLTSYFKAFKTVGLSVDQLVEPRPSDVVIEKIPDFANDLRMSHFIVLELSKQR